MRQRPMTLRPSAKNRSDYELDICLFFLNAYHNELVQLNVQHFCCSFIATFAHSSVYVLYIYICLFDFNSEKKQFLP